MAEELCQAIHYHESGDLVRCTLTPGHPGSHIAKRNGKPVFWFGIYEKDAKEVIQRMRDSEDIRRDLVEKVVKKLEDRISEAESALRHPSMFLSERNRIHGVISAYKLAIRFLKEEL